MEDIKIANKSIEIDNTKADNHAQMPSIAPDTSTIEAEAKETASGLSKKTALKGERKHTVIYLAGGIWCDSTGKYWCRDQKKNCVSSMTFTDSELDNRPDIRYMIGYGTMKDVIVD